MTFVTNLEWKRDEEVKVEIKSPNKSMSEPKSK